MRTLKPLVATCLLAAALPALAHEIEAPPAALSGAQLVEATATVEAVDPASRLVTLKGPKGALVTVEAGDEVKNLDKVKTGDLVNIKYYRSMVVNVVPAGEAQSGTGPTVTTHRVTAEPGTAPAGAVAWQQHKTVKITSIDPYKKSIAFRDDQGRIREIWVDKPELEHYLKDLKEGETVEVTYTRALAVSLEPR